MVGSTAVECTLLAEEVATWLKYNVIEALSVDSVENLNVTKCKSMNKDLMSRHFVQAVLHLSEENSYLEKFSLLKEENEALKSKLIDSQQQVIDLQVDLLASKTDQMQAVQSTVKAEVAGVQTAVKTEIGSWSKFVQQSTANTATHISPARIKEAVKSAVAEDDRSRNVIIFGKQEEDNETVSDTVSAVFEDLNEKPRVVECRRIGTISHGKCRPIKVKLSSSEAVLHILRNAKTLKTSANNSSTYIAQDRTTEERSQHKDLVAMVRAKMNSEPGMYHFIRGGAVVTVKKKT
jgi:cob(I)alamin adenosyltransferase